MDSSRIDDIIEGIRSGPAEELDSYCDKIIRLWRTAPVEELLSLKEQFRKLGIEHRESVLEEALITIAEKRPAAFTGIATEPGHPLWRPALEVLSMVDNPEYLDLFISLVPLCPKKDLCVLIQAIGCFRCTKAVDALSGLLRVADESTLLEVVLALKRCGVGGASGPLRELMEDKKEKGSAMASVLEAVLNDMECGKDTGAKRGPA